MIWTRGIHLIYLWYVSLELNWIMQQLCLFMMKLAQPSLNQDNLLIYSSLIIKYRFYGYRELFTPNVTNLKEHKWVFILGAYAPSWLFLVPSSLGTKINIHLWASRFMIFWLGYIFIPIKMCIWDIKLRGILSSSWIKPVWAPWFSKMYVIYNFVTTSYVKENFSFIQEIQNIIFEFIFLTTKIHFQNIDLTFWRLK